MPFVCFLGEGYHSGHRHLDLHQPNHGHSFAASAVALLAAAQDWLAVPPRYLAPLPVVPCENQNGPPVLAFVLDAPAAAVGKAVVQDATDFVYVVFGTVAVLFYVICAVVVVLPDFPGAATLDSAIVGAAGDNVVVAAFAVVGKVSDFAGVSIVLMDALYAAVYSATDFAASAAAAAHAVASAVAPAALLVPLLLLQLLLLLLPLML